MIAWRILRNNQLRKISIEDNTSTRMNSNVIMVWLHHVITMSSIDHAIVGSGSCNWKCPDIHVSASLLYPFGSKPFTESGPSSSSLLQDCNQVCSRILSFSSKLHWLVFLHSLHSSSTCELVLDGLKWTHECLPRFLWQQTEWEMSRLLHLLRLKVILYNISAAACYLWLRSTWDMRQRLVTLCLI